MSRIIFIRHLISLSLSLSLMLRLIQKKFVIKSYPTEVLLGQLFVFGIVIWIDSIEIHQTTDENSNDDDEWRDMAIHSYPHTHIYQNEIQRSRILSNVSQNVTFIENRYPPTVLWFPNFWWLRFYFGNS